LAERSRSQQNRFDSAQRTAQLNGIGAQVVYKDWSAIALAIACKTAKAVLLQLPRFIFRGFRDFRG